MAIEMRPAHVVEITTPKKVKLYGLWYGPRRATRVIVIIHGLTGSMFSYVPRAFPTHLIDSRTAVLSFNNRGHGIVSRIHYGKRQLLAGSAHEIFRDSVDDIRGAVDFAKKNGARDIYIAGHSTGCQKAVLYSSKLPTRARVKGLILFGPVSDHAVAVRDDRHGRLSKAVGIARRLVRTGRPHEMMPRALRTKWSINDAQRFLSLYTPDSAETIFSYEQPKKIPSALHAIKIPQLILWAKRDEYADRPAKEIAAWFEKHVRKGRIVIVPKVGHGFKGGERFVARQIKEFMKE